MNSKLLLEIAVPTWLMSKVLPSVEGRLKRHQEGLRRYTLEGLPR